MAYINWSKNLVVQTSDKKLYIIQSEKPTAKVTEVNFEFDSDVLRSSACDENTEFALMTKNQVYFFDSNTYKFKRKTTLELSKITYGRVPKGTKVMLALSDKQLVLFEVDSLNIFHTETLSTSETWLYYFIGTNKFMTQKTVDSKLIYTSYSFNLDDARVCSKTCNGKCAGKNFY